MKTSKLKSEIGTVDLRALMVWMRGTDLDEISYRRGAAKVRIGLEGTHSASERAFPPCSLTPVASEEVGIFRSSSPGRPHTVEKGDQVKKGAVMGVVDTGKKKVKIAAPADGKVVSVLAEDGKPVEYGQPLFFIQQ